MVKLKEREMMKYLIRIFTLVVFLAPTGLWANSPLSGTAGSNLTGFNANTGAMNNNQWNQLMNSGNRSTGPVADFGNCNALILRCAQPKCANGGCVDIQIATTIVNGCVMANETCKKHGEPLIQAIAAQLVASSTAKANEQSAQAAALAQAASNSAASAQSQQQMQAMQNQMAQMQNQMQQQNLASEQALQSALAAATTNQVEQNSNESNSDAVNQAYENAAQMGISADALVREQASGQILTQMENATVALKEVKATMQTVFDYAGCDSSGNNCVGPKRAAAFKNKAMQFFDPYETVLDEVYDALVLAQSLGVDITDIYMMLSGSCNRWGKYLCGVDQTMHHDITSCPNGLSTVSKRPCKIGQVKDMSDGGCQLIQMLANNEEVEQNWLYPANQLDPDDSTKILSEVRVGCASESLDNSALFRSRKKQSTIDVEVLKRIIEQDAPSIIGMNQTAEKEAIKFCAVGTEGYQNLQKNVSLKKLPTKVCTTNTNLKSQNIGAFIDYDEKNSGSAYTNPLALDCNSPFYASSNECKCRDSGGDWMLSNKCRCGLGLEYDSSSKSCVISSARSANSLGVFGQGTELDYEKNLKTLNTNMKKSTSEFNQSKCKLYGGNWIGNKCDCSFAKDKGDCLTNTVGL